MNLVQVIEEMQAEFEAYNLVVGLAPQKRRTNEGGMIRVVLSKNADWYRALCAKHLSSRKRNHRKLDTLIKREATRRALEKLRKLAELVTDETQFVTIALGPRVPAKYVERILPFIIDRARNPKRLTKAEKKSLEALDREIDAWDSKNPFGE